MACKKKKKNPAPQVGEPVGQPLEAGENLGMAPVVEDMRHSDGIASSIFFVGIVLALVCGLYLGNLGTIFFSPNASNTSVPAQAPGGALLQPPTEQPNAGKAMLPAGKTSVPAAAIPPEFAARIATLEKKVTANPADAQSWAELGNLYFDVNQPRMAVTAYQESLRISPDNVDVLTDMGIMLRELGEFENAVASFRRASSVNPRHENAMFNEGVVLYYDLGRKGEAMKAWQRLLAVNPQASTPDGKAVSELLRQLP